MGREPATSPPVRLPCKEGGAPRQQGGVRAAAGHGGRPAHLHRLPACALVEICSNNPIERLNRGLKHRNDVVQISPNVKFVVRLIGVLLVEMSDEVIAPGSVAALPDGSDLRSSLLAAPRT